MPDPNDPRYRGTGPPSLEQLRALLLNAKAESFRSPDGKYSEIRFKVDNEKLFASGQSYYGTDSQIHAGFIEIVDRITEFEELTKRHADNITGVTCDDIIAQLRLELSHVNPRAGLIGALQAAMFENAIKKMEELKEWRRAADQKRREKERAQREKMKKDRERMEAEAEILREQMKREQMWNERRKAREEQQRKESAAGSDPGSSSRQQKDTFEEDFWRAFYQGDGSSEWAKQYQQQWRDAFSDMHNRQRQQYHSGHTEQEKQQRSKARNKTRAPWFEVLGVQPTATEIEIKKAWRVKASALHPDKPENRGDPDKLERLKDVNTAKDEGIRGLR